MELLYFYHDESIYITSNTDLTDSFISLDRTKEFALIRRTNLQEFANSHQIKEIVLIGGEDVLPQGTYFIQTYKGCCLRINNDFKYGIIGHNYYPVLRYHGYRNASVSSENRLLLMIDRPLRYHLDAFLCYCLYKPYYHIDIWDGSNISNSEELNKFYDIAIHYGHCDAEYFIFGKTKICELPQSNIFVSHGCNSIQLFLKRNQPVTAFCGFSYYCNGQMPVVGSNKLLIEMLHNLLCNMSLSQALITAKKKYIKNSINVDFNRTLLYANSEQELIDLTTVISCNTLSDSYLHTKKRKKEQIPYSYGTMHSIPIYSQTMLMIISSNDSQLNITIYDRDEHAFYLSNSKIKRYSEVDGEYSDIIYSISGNDYYILLNKQYAYVKIEPAACIQYFYT
jgi:hypothetical protein|nr:hypothetical protein [uncultured Acetatifactor sp.]